MNTANISLSESSSNGQTRSAFLIQNYKGLTGSCLIRAVGHYRSAQKIILRDRGSSSIKLIYESAVLSDASGFMTDRECEGYYIPKNRNVYGEIKSCFDN